MKFNLRWRLISLLAIVLYVLSTLAIIRLALTNLIFFAFLATTSIAIVYTAWLTFTGEGKQFRRGALLLTASLITLAIEIIVFVSEENNLRYLLVAAILTSLYLIVFSLFRKEYWQEKLLKHITSKEISFKKPYLILNPKSGNGRAIKAKTPHAAEKMGIKVLIMKKGENVEGLARKAVEDGADVLGISGGDGSIGTVAKVAIENDLPMVVLPGGTRCHFARDIGMLPKQINDALSSFYGVERRIDVGKINDRVFMNNASFGVYADIVNNKEYRNNKITITRRVLRQILSGNKKPYDLSIDNHGHKFNKAIMVLIGVNRYNTINLMELGQRPRLDEGVLQINVLSKVTNQLIANVLRNASINQIEQTSSLEEFSQWETKKIEISGKGKKVVVGVDGECEEYSSPVNVEIMPKALRLFVPPEGMRSRPQKAFSRRGFKQLWEAVR